MADILDSYPSSLLESVLRHRGLMKCAADARGCTPAQNAALTLAEDAIGLIRSLLAATRNAALKSDDVADMSAYLLKAYEALHAIEVEVASYFGMDARRVEFTVSRIFAEERFLCHLGVLRDTLRDEEEYAESPVGRAAYDAEYRASVAREERAA